MKRLKYVLPILAVMIAVVVAFAFKSAPKESIAVKKPTAMAYFQYTPPTPGDYSSTSVQNRNNWHYYTGATPTTECPEGQDAACIISVQDTYYHIPFGETDPVLNTSAPAPLLVISVAESNNVDDFYYVSAISSGSPSDLFNRVEE